MLLAMVQFNSIYEIDIEFNVNQYWFLFLADMQDFSQLSSKMVTEVLMLEIKMAPAAKAYLISGFPRSMRDVVEYSDKVHYLTVNISISISIYNPSNTNCSLSNQL